MAISCQSVSIDPMDEPSAVVRVMIADDSTPIRERLAALLWEIPGVVVIAETSDVPATMERVLDLLPDIVLLDINMPGGTGFDVLEHIRDQGLSTMAVVITTHEESEYENRARASGAAAFFNKSRDFIAAAEFVRKFTQEGHR